MDQTGETAFVDRNVYTCREETPQETAAPAAPAPGEPLDLNGALQALFLSLHCPLEVKIVLYPKLRPQRLFLWGCIFSCVCNQ